VGSWDACSFVESRPWERMCRARVKDAPTRNGSLGPIMLCTNKLWFVLLWSILRTSPSVNTFLKQLCKPFDRAATVFSRAISLTVSELFMTLAVPTAAAFDARFARRLMCLVSITLYSSNFLKTLLRLPRPQAADGEGALSREEGGFGFPSLHCAAGMALPCFLMSQASPLAGVLATGTPRHVSLAYPALIGFARLQLGVHSLPDVAGGWLLGLVISHNFEKLVGSGVFEQWFSAQLAAPAVVSLAIALALAHPRNRAHGEGVGGGKERDDAPSDGSVTESAIVLGCSLGAVLAIWREAQLPSWQPKPLGLGYGRRDLALRCLLALVCTGAAKSAFKPLAKRLVAAAFQLYGRARLLERVRDREEPIAKVFCYGPMAWVLLDVVPALCASSPRSA
jgi:membrane-associated phospholipid phosphatase